MALIAVVRMNREVVSRMEKREKFKPLLLSDLLKQKTWRADLILESLECNGYPKIMMIR